ncbi:hypothetical protein JHD50_02650 [Sulfurimonas sp. MAG313]|nr:hypothetical protein [Sulfurimonas sp. MAG313]MDF1880212.1 hypothetical protein [Sulfurimonas sp. MAG313]
MLIFGHPHIENEKLYHINSIQAIEHTPSNSVLLFDFDAEVYELIEYAKENALEFALNISSLKDAILGENLDAKYLLLSQELAYPVQKAADAYLFDAKILVHGENEDIIEGLASKGIDGLIFAQAIIKVS